MAKLSKAARIKLPSDDFAIPSKGKGNSGSYPMPDRNHMKAALSMVSRWGSPEEQAEVRAKAKAKFGVGQAK